jgi:hypothetical protein
MGVNLQTVLTLIFYNNRCFLSIPGFVTNISFQFYSVNTRCFAAGSGPGDFDDLPVQSCSCTAGIQSIFVRKIFPENDFVNLYKFEKKIGKK